MKKLILVRHGKSSWEYSVGDKDRPLKERGINDAKLVSNEFAMIDRELDAIFSSPANRALHTCMIFIRELNFPLHKFQVSNLLYDFSGEYVLELIKELSDDLQVVMLFGHNHAFTHLANSLGSIYIDNVPTSGLVEIDFQINSWSDISKGTTTQTIFPKRLKA